MLNRMSDWFYQKSSGWLVIAGVLLFVVFSLTVLPAQSAQAAVYSAAVGTPDTSLFYSRQDLAHMAEVYGLDGRQAYVRARFSFDLVFPLIYTFFLITSISWVMKHLVAADSPWRRLNLLPLAAMLLDFLENICAAQVMASYPTLRPAAASLAVIFTPLKWLMVGISFLLLLMAFLFFVFRKKTS
jgi:hypothetical protein